MTPEEITTTLKDLFGETVAASPPFSWQVETEKCRLLVLLSDDLSWLRILVPIVPAQEVKQVFDKLLEANFDITQETRYALHQNVLWGVFQHTRESLNLEDFSLAIKRLLSLHERGVLSFYDDLIETQLRQIIQVAKRQGQSKEATMQTLERFYAEGLMGGIEMGNEAREQTLAAWQWQLDRLWPEVEPEG